MPAKKCFFCNHVRNCPIRLTEVNQDGTVETVYLCEQCGGKYIEAVSQGEAKPKQKETQVGVVDLTQINTPEELLDFLVGLEHPEKKEPMEPCRCGLTEEEFDNKGRFGCPECYNHFRIKMEQLVFPYHGARSHCGKIPKAQLMDKWMSDPVEKEKLLKLRFAKALELEEYEKAAEIKKELDALKTEPLP